MALAYRELEVWQKAFDLAMKVWDLAEAPGVASRFWLKDQLSSAAMSVPANIAEGNGRTTPLDYASFLDRARASLFEVDTWLLAIERRGYAADADFSGLRREIDSVSAMLYRMAAQIRKRSELPSRA